MAYYYSLSIPLHVLIDVEHVDNEWQLEMAFV